MNRKPSWSQNQAFDCIVKALKIGHHCTVPEWKGIEAEIMLDKSKGIIYYLERNKEPIEFTVDGEFLIRNDWEIILP